MKTIVFATDFSRGSRKAAQTAAHTAVKTGAKLVLFHAYRYTMPFDSEISSLPVSAEESRKYSILMLKRLKKRIIQKFPQILEIEIKAVEGLVIETLEKTLKTVNADLLIMGTVGNSPLGTRYFGSLATSMIHHSSVPVLLVPPKTKFSAFQSAVLGLDFNYEIDEEQLSKAIGLLRYFDTVVNLFTVTSESETAKDKALKVRELFHNVPHTCMIVEHENFIKSILSFALENRMDLIVAFPRKQNFFKRLFNDSNSEQLALNDYIPILNIV